LTLSPEGGRRPEVKSFRDELLSIKNNYHECQGGEVFLPIGFPG
jgi:hypothetical protein